MAPIQVFAPIAWLMTMTLAGNEAHQQSVKLKTRPSDGAALCALDPPTLSAAMSPKMPGAPDAVRCGMTCTSDGGCKHFNYVSTESNPCQLYHYRPTNFDVSPNCRHYYLPGQQNIPYIERISSFLLFAEYSLLCHSEITDSRGILRPKATSPPVTGDAKCVTEIPVWISGEIPVGISGSWGTKFKFGQLIRSKIVKIVATRCHSAPPNP